MLGNHKIKDLFLDGIIRNNPTFVLFLGMCPTLATTSTFQGAIGMAIATIIVLTISCFAVSCIKSFVPSDVRIPVYVIIIATITKTIELYMQGYIPTLYASLGIYLPLIVVNCIVLGRIEAFAQKNPIIPSTLDGFATGLGFMISLALVAFTRELFGTGGIVFPNYFNMKEMLFSFQLFPREYAIILLISPPGAFITLGILAGFFTYLQIKYTEKQILAERASIGGNH